MRARSSFVDSSVYHRDLHSFPTRRSSDLPFYRRRRNQRCLAHLSARPRLCLATRHHWLSRALDGRARGTRRSEEHTSELQSRQYLVCRLLLEKKKNTIPGRASAESSSVYP